MAHTVEGTVAPVGPRKPRKRCTTVGSGGGEWLNAIGPREATNRGVFARMMAGLSAGHGEQKTVMSDATYLKAHRTATSMGVKKGDADA